jgi:hypothetical protein
VDRTTRFIALTAMILWTAGDALRAVLEPMTEMTDGLPEDDLEALATVVRRTAQLAPTKRIALSGEELENLSPRLGLLLLPRAPLRERTAIWRNCLDNAQILAPDLLGRTLLERSLARVKRQTGVCAAYYSAQRSGQARSIRHARLSARRSRERRRCEHPADPAK